MKGVSLNILTSHSHVYYAGASRRHDDNIYAALVQTISDDSQTLLFFIYSDSATPWLDYY